MKESTKEWLGIKPADFFVYAALVLIIPMYQTKSFIADTALLIVGILLCIVSCYLGMKPHPDLGKINNGIKLIAYPACTIFFMYVGYLNFTKWV